MPSCKFCTVKGESGSSGIQGDPGDTYSLVLSCYSGGTIGSPTILPTSGVYTLDSSINKYYSLPEGNANDYVVFQSKYLIESIIWRIHKSNRCSLICFLFGWLFLNNVHHLLLYGFLL